MKVRSLRRLKYARGPSRLTFLQVFRRAVNKFAPALVANLQSNNALLQLIRRRGQVAPLVHKAGQMGASK